MQKYSEEGSKSSRFLKNSIKGLNKIFIFIKGGSKDTKKLIQSKIQSVYKIVHKTTNTKAKIQLFIFLFQYHSHIHGNLTDRYYRTLYEFIAREEILHCSLNQLFFDLTLISIKQDTNVNRMLAFVKRMLQLCFSAQANFVVTTLIMMGKIVQQKQAFRIMLRQKQNSLCQSQDKKTYDMWKRQPIYSGAQLTCLWQLTIFKNHYHPTVRKFANHLIAGQDIPYDGHNPLIELSQTSFLQKMGLKKEKKSMSWRIKISKNLRKIRSSKYQTLMDKPLQSFKEDQEFIKKYLAKRLSIHQNFNKMQIPKDIEDFADQVIEKQMERLNPKHDNFELSMTPSAQDQSNKDDLSEGEQGGEHFQDDEFGGQDEGDDEGEMEDGQDDIDQEHYNHQDSEDQQDIHQSSDEKQFQQVFDQIGSDDDNYHKKKPKLSFKKRNVKQKKPIHKGRKQPHGKKVKRR